MYDKDLSGQFRYIGYTGANGAGTVPRGGWMRIIPEIVYEPPNPNRQEYNSGVYVGEGGASGASGASGVYDHINHRINPPGYLTVGGSIKDPKKMKQCLSCGGKCGGDKQTGCMFYANVARETITQEQKWRKEELARKDREGREGKNLQQELDEAKARCLKLEGVIEYLEKQAKK